MYETHKEQVDFYLIYTKEAHASDSSRPNSSVSIKQHTSIEERAKAAQSCIGDLKITIPTLIDDMQDSVGNAYSGHPDRLFIINSEGVIAYRGDKGPHGFDAEAMKKSLDTMLK